MKLMPLPQFRGEAFEDIIVNLYKDLGWDGEKTVIPDNIIMNEDDWKELLQYVQSHSGSVDHMVGNGLRLTNYGPSGDDDIPPGHVRLLDGWVQDSPSL